MAAPELRLNVTLDLASFRSQLGKLAQTAAAYYYPVNLIIDKKNFEAQLKALGKIKPVININDDQLIAARTRIGTLNKSLATLRRATATPIEIKIKYVEEGKPPTGAISKSGTFRQRLTGLDTEPIKQLYAAAGKAGIVQFDAEIAKNKGKIITALNQAGESSVTGLLNGLKSKDSAVKTAAKSLGDILIAALKLSLQIQSPSKRMEAIGEDAGEGFNKGLKESLSEAKDSAVSKMRELVAALRIEAAKIQNISLAPGSLRGASAPASLRGGPRGGRGYFNSIGPLPEGSKEPYTMTDRGYQPYLGGPGVGSSAAPRGLLPPASAIGRGSRGQSFAGAPINFSMGAFPQLPPSGTANQLRQQVRMAQAHLRSAERSVAVFGERAAMLDKAMSAFRTSGRATGYTSPIGPLPRDSAEPYAAGSRGMFGKEGFEARLESRPIAGLLPPGSTPTREQIVAMREKIARQRSDARALDVQLEDRLRPTVPPRQYFQPNTQPLLPGSGGALARSSAIAPYGALALRGGGGGLPPGGGGGGNPPTPPSSGGRGSGFFGGMQFNMPKLPGAGIVQGLGTEFAFAAKQVLLFGTAYKALAFLTDFPSQVGAAVGQLQSFRNTLNAVSPSAQEAAQSSQFILDVVDKYNVPLQSARDGFTRLYASMQPAGFGGNEIRDLFLGISQAAATFGMSADKVDRVNYAFAQMASKGQVMSEELKGQLGDVLPGSMALFAKAAGFKGPQAITKFSKALEDGVYKGGAMKTLLTNVGIVMSKEFGPGAEGAAKTFQGSINRMQNSLKLFYETFEPVAVGFLNAVVTPMTSGIKTLTDGFNAFFTGQAAQTTSGNVLAQQLEQLRPAFDGIRNNITQILPLLQSFGKTALSLGSILLQIAGNPFVGYLARVYLAVLPLTIAIQALNLSALIPLIRNLLAAVPAFVAFTVSQLRGMSTLGSFKAATYGLGLTAAATGVKIRLLSGIIKTAFATTVIGVALLGIGMLIEKLMMAGFKADEAKQKMLQFADSVKQAGKAGDVAGLVTTLAEEKGMAKRMQNAKALLEEIKKGKKSISEQQKQELEGLGLTSNMAFFQEGGPKNLSKNLTVQVSMFGVLDANIQAAQQGYLEAQTKIIQSQKALNVAKTKQVKEEKELEKIKFEGGDDGKAAEKEAERQAKLEDKLANRDQQLAVDAANRQVALDQSTFDSRLRMSDAEYDHLRALQDDYFERQISGLDSIEARQKKHQQDLTAIENRRIDSIRKAELDAVKAVQDLRTASIKAAAVTGGAPGAAKFGDTGRTFNAPGFVHGHVQNMDRGALKGDATSLVKSLLQQGVTPELGSGAQFSRSMSDAQIADLVGRGIAAHKQYASGAGAIDIFVPKGTPVPMPLSNVGNLGGAAGVTGTMPGGSQLMHLDPSSKSSSVGLATRSGAFAMGRREDKAEGQLAVEQQDAQNRAVEKLATIRNANNLALQQTITLVKQNIDSIFPLREQQLENDLLELRNNLESKGVSKQMIDMEVEKAKRSKESALAAEVYTKKIDESTAALERYNKMKTLTPEDKSEMARLTAEIDLYKKTLADLPELQGRFNNELARTATLTTESSFESAMTSLKDRMKMAQAFTPGQELKTQIALDNPDLSPEQQQVLFDTTQATIKLEELKEKVKNISQSIGDALGNSLNSGIQGLIAGTANAQQIFSDFLKSMGDILIQEGVKMIATYTAIAIAKSLAGLFSGGGSAIAGGGAFGGAASSSTFSAGTGTAFGGMSIPGFAEGGRPPIGRPSLVGELGPELFVPSSSGTIIPADATEALLASRNALRSSSTSGPTNAFEENRQMLDASASISRERYIEKTLSSGASSTEIKYSRVGSGDLPFVTEADMLQASRTAAQEGARMGQQRTLAALKNNPGARRAIGI